MSYGASARLVPARGGGGITDADILKIGIIGDFRRGIAQVQRDIFDFDTFAEKQGGTNTNILSPWIAKEFFNELNNDISVEIVTRGYVASDAVQATGILLDTDGSPVKIFDIKAAYKNVIDKSEFGNDIAYQVENSENQTYSLQADIIATATTATLNTTDGLEVGYYMRFKDGATEEGVEILTINRVTNAITFAAITNPYVAATSVFTRLDWTLKISVKDDTGVFQLKETFSEIPFAQSDTIGMPALTNDVNTGSKYVQLAVDGTNASVELDQRPAVVSSWTQLTSGSDGTAAGDSDYNALQTEMQDTGVFFMAAPESSSITHNQNFADFATDGSKWIFYGQSSNNADEDTLKLLGQSLRKSISFAMIPSDKWITVAQGNGEKIDIPKVGHDMAHWYNVYSVTDEDKVAAGNAWPLKTSGTLIDNGIVHDDKNGQGQRLIENYSINICRFQSGKGITNNSARTLSTDLGYIYQNQLAGTILIKRSILSYLQSIEQDKSGAKAQKAHRSSVRSFLKKKYDNDIFFRGFLPDGTPTRFANVVTIINDFSNNTLADIANGIEVTFVQVIWTPPIEKPRLDLASASVTTITS